MFNLENIICSFIFGCLSIVLIFGKRYLALSKHVRDSNSQMFQNQKATLVKGDLKGLEK
jgi:hypothetical protein